MTIQTQRLLLRQWHADDRQPWAEICSDPEVMRYIGAGGPFTTAQATAELEQFQRAWQTHGYSYFAAELRDQHQLIGFIGVSPLPDEDALDFGWRLARSTWGQGLATEGALAARDWAFSTLNAPALIAAFRPDNHASRRVATKAGLTYKSEDVKHNGPVIVYQLTRADWQKHTLTPDQGHQ